MHCRSYRCLTPELLTPKVHDVVEEKIDDYPEFSDSQKQIIRQAMNGNPQAVRKSI